MWKLMLLLGASAAAFAGGMRTQSQLDAGRAVKELVRAVTVVQKQGQVNAQVAQAAQAHQDQVRTVTRTLIEKVPQYVDVQADAACVVPVGAVRVLDAAAAGRELSPVAEGPGHPDDAPSGVALSQVTTSVVGNYGTANATRQQLLDLQEWVRRQGLAD